MNRLTLSIAMLVAVWASSSARASAAAKVSDLAKPLSLEIMPVSEVKPGMKGYGLTVMRGVDIERFDIEVIGVIPAFIPGVPIIAFRMDHPLLNHTGVVGGMSGSPIIIVEGKRERVVGALAYGATFGKDPIAFATPHEEMLKELDRPLRGPGPVASSAFSRPPMPTAVSAPAPFPSATAGPFRVPFSGAPAPAGAITPVAIPISLSGVASPVINELQDTLAPYGIVPTFGGGKGTAKAGAYFKDVRTRFTPGSAIGVTLFSGDMEGVATGTVSWVKGSKVIAFGHPMFRGGEAYIPTTTAWIHMILASVARSVKVSSALHPVGSLEQDRNTCIVADVEKSAPMVPITVTVKDSSTGKVFPFRVRLLSHRMFTPLFSLSVIRNALMIGASDITDTVYRFKMTVKLRGHPEFSMESDFYSPFGAMARGVLERSRAFSGLEKLMKNTFEPIFFERVDAEFDVSYEPEFGVLVGAFFDRSAARPGERINLTLVVRRFDEREEVRVIPFEVPARTGGSKLKVSIEGGSTAKGIAAKPATFEDLLRKISKSYPGESVLITTTLPEAGVEFHGKLVPSLPTSALDALSGGKSRSTAGKGYRHVRETVVKMPDLVVGKTSLELIILDEDK